MLRPGALVTAYVFIYLSIYLSVCMSVCVFICVCVCVCVCVYFCVCLFVRRFGCAPGRNVYYNRCAFRFMHILKIGICQRQRQLCVCRHQRVCYVYIKKSNFSSLHPPNRRASVFYKILSLPSLSLSIYIYIYISICVCVCVCV